MVFFPDRAAHFHHHCHSAPRLFDIDIIIRRTVMYALVTALLVIVFLGSVILLQQIFSGITGSGQDEIVTVLSTLAIAALFVPLRRRIQNLIDRRFNRNRYDARQVLHHFAQRRVMKPTWKN